MSVYAKAVYAAVMAALTAASAIYVDNVVLVIVLAALTPLGVYLVPNKDAEPLDKGFNTP